jgi:hypothetical protein
MYKLSVTIEPLGISSNQVTSNIQNIVDTLGIDSNFIQASATMSAFGIDELNELLVELGLYTSLFDTEG